MRTKTGLPVIELSCANLMSWRIERISPSSLDLCRGHSTSGVKCNAKIAKYQRAVATPTFMVFSAFESLVKLNKCNFGFVPGSFKLALRILAPGLSFITPCFLMLSLYSVGRI